MIAFIYLRMADDFPDLHAMFKDDANAIPFFFCRLMQ